MKATEKNELINTMNTTLKTIGDLKKAKYVSKSIKTELRDNLIQVRLKVENHSNPTQSVETEATTTLANGWQTLVFNFANQAPGTAALNLAYSLDKASV